MWCIVLRVSCYAIPGTDVVYHATRANGTRPPLPIAFLSGEAVSGTNLLRNPRTNNRVSGTILRIIVVCLAFAIPGTDISYQGMACRLLPASAMPGTEKPYHLPPVLSPELRNRIGYVVCGTSISYQLPPAYAMSGTDMAYQLPRAYAMSGTDMAYQLQSPYRHFQASPCVLVQVSYATCLRARVWSAMSGTDITYVRQCPVLTWCICMQGAPQG
eukprot:3177312-Rhodomonas_salina.6